ncbi:MAG: dihydrofolate reductase [Dermatophilus congolensis]|nr:dihydrofolate reductase [Dermatophilus congolensis]
MSANVTDGANVNPDQYVVVVVAVARNGVIGANGGMPWHLPEDLAHFKTATMGTPMVMGRKTFESIGRPLPGRRSIVVTRDRAWQHAGVEVAHGIAEAFELAGPGRVSLIGGGELFARSMSADPATAPEAADELIVTYVDAAPQGDTFLPPVDERVWEVVERRPGTGCEYVTYRRAGVTPDAGA